MYGRAGLDRFKKAQTFEPFSVSSNSASKSASQSVSRPITHPSVLHSPSQTSVLQSQYQHELHVPQKPVVLEAAPLVGQTQHVTQVGGGQSTWQPPDWAIEPRLGVYYLEVLKDREVLNRINLDRRRSIFGRQFHNCDFVLESVSCQHAAVVPHKNGSLSLSCLGCLIVYYTLTSSGQHGVDIETEPGPVGVKEGSLVGKYESLVQITVISKRKEQNSGKERSFGKEDSLSPKGVTDKLQEVLNKVKGAPKSGIYDDLYGESFSGKLGSSWAYSSVSTNASTKEIEEKSSVKPGNILSHADDNEDDDDLFGD